MSKWRDAIQQHFSRALPWSVLLDRTDQVLHHYGMTHENTLLANVTCRDEINQRNIRALSARWGENFQLAGLAGYPSGGKTGFSAYASHVPEGGYLFLFYGPHLGIGHHGRLGLAQRPGRRSDDDTCGSLLSCLKKFQADANDKPTFSFDDAEQYLVESTLHPHRDAIIKNPSPIQAITMMMFQKIDAQVHAQLMALEFPRQIALLGGLILNTPKVSEQVEDYFLPLRADLRNVKNLPDTRLDWLDELCRTDRLTS